MKRRTITRIFRSCTACSPSANGRLAGIGLAAALSCVGTAAAGEVPFSSQQVITTAADGARVVIAADLDGDGDLDALSASSSDDTIAWYENLGPDDGSGPCGAATTACFGAWQVVSSAIDDTRSVFAADLDRDGKVDVLTASYSPSSSDLAWYRNLGPDDGSGPCGVTTTACFGGQQVIATGADRILAVSAADVDGDGDLDVLLAVLHDNTVNWYENLGPDDGSGPCGTTTTACFGVQHVVWSGLFPKAIRAADMDGDGDLDVLLGCEGLLGSGGCLSWSENLGPTFAGHSIASAGLGTFAGPPSVEAVDLDADGDLDALAASGAYSGGDGEVSWFENLGPDSGTGPCGVMTTACFGPQQVIWTTSEAFLSVSAADVDGDGDPDALSISDANKVLWFENLGPDDGSGACGVVTATCFGGERVISGAVDSSVDAMVAATDLDADGDLDVLSSSANDDTIAWYENLTIHRSADFPVSLPISQDAAGVDQLAVGDLDGDGDADLLSAETAADQIAVYRNNGDGTTSTLVKFGVAGPNAVAAADLDRDGDLDALSASASKDALDWHENTSGDGSSWSPTRITDLAAGANDVAVADLDGDGDLDALSASTDDDRIAWYENRLDEPSADFGLQQTISTAAEGARSVAAADLDGDGDADVVSASQDDHKIAWYENRLNEPSADFAPQQIVISLTASSAQSVFAADVDRDGDLDVLAGDEKKVAWYENDGSGVFPQTHTVAVPNSLINEVWATDLDRDGDPDVLAALPNADQVVWYEQTPSGWVPHVVAEPVSGARHAIATDIDRDGSPDIVFAAGDDALVAWHPNGGGQFSTAATDTAQRVVSNGQMEDALAVQVTHEGRAGDTDIELVELEIRLTDSGGTPLASAQANALIDAARIYRDDGSGVFEEAYDTLITTVSSFTLVGDGIQTLPVTDDDPNARIAFGAPVIFFVTFEMTANAESQFVDAFRVKHTASADAADDADHDIPLDLDDGEEVVTGVVDTALSTATCTAPFDLNLENRTITTTVICEAGTVLRTAAGMVVASPGDLTLRAGAGVQIGDGLETATGAALQVD